MNESEKTVSKFYPAVKLTEEESKRFWDKVAIIDEIDCWIWTSSRHKYGYGNFGFRGTTERSHRLSYRIHKGDVPAGMCVLHKCDVPSCVNPDHLFIGTHTDNMQDKTIKKRNNPPIGDRNALRKYPELIAHGSKSHFAKLDESKVIEIRRIYADDGLTQCQIAERFNVSQDSISLIVNRKTWTHI